MSDRAITGAELNGYLDHKHVKRDCPACGQPDGMSISVDESAESSGGDAPAVWLLHRLPDKPNLGFGVYVLVCSNCGYIRFFRDIEVLDFLNEGEDNG